MIGSLAADLVSPDLNYGEKACYSTEYLHLGLGALLGCRLSDTYSIVVYFYTDFHREIVSEMGELGVLGPTIKGEQAQNHAVII